MGIITAKHSYTLKKSRLAFWREISDGGVEHNAQKAVANSRRNNADKQKLYVMCKIKNHKTDDKKCKHRYDKLVFAVFIDELAYKNYSDNKRNKANDGNYNECRSDFESLPAKNPSGLCCKYIIRYGKKTCNATE